MPIRDTSSSAQIVQLQIQRAMSGEQRLLLAFEMSMFTRELAGGRIRQEHPEWPETRVARTREAGISAGDNAAAAMSVPEVFRWENLGTPAIETIVWVCLAFSILAADMVLQWQELRR